MRALLVYPGMRSVLTTGLAIVLGLAIVAGLYFLGRLLSINLIGIVGIIYALTMVGGGFVHWRRGRKATDRLTNPSAQ
ncbi:hypothetical protein JK358_26325 [Nocardia sp. 2]|uniref:DUF4175 domain-containing protein n=1 Tax=Nocardia acididurans TaxID=2802282 RepID=A0ABS1MBB3_9NOCA|nr:hypothetical protein [Nocardia acididurans]MBL1077926.1 hypothetical protein [Nocardia acididurans]